MPLYESFLLFLFLYIPTVGASGQFACNAQDVIFIFDTKTDSRVLDDWRALAGDFVDKFNMKADQTSIYARFAALQFGDDTYFTSASPYPSQDNNSIVFGFDDYTSRDDVKRAITLYVDDYRAAGTSIGGVLVDATTVLPDRGNRTLVIILFTNGLAGYNDRSEATSQAEILRNILGVDIWIILAEDVTDRYYFDDAFSFGYDLTNRQYREFNSTSVALRNDGIFTAYAGDYPCPGPSTTAVPPVIDPCPCTIEKSWNDVMIIADGSDNMGQNRFTEMWGFIVSVLAGATIGQQDAYQTRVGVITYGNNATLIAPLNFYQNSDQFVSQMWPFKNEEYTNILGGVTMALNEFKKDGRPKSRKVMIIAASTYRDGPYHIPLNETETFRLNFGVVIVIGYGNMNGQGAEILQGMASPGFYIDATNGAPDLAVLQQLICNANCFCPGQSSDEGYYSVNDPSQAWPSGGCFWDSTLTAIKQVADTICRNTEAAAGYLAQPKLIAQQRAIIQQTTVTNPAKPPFFIGLTRQNGNWLWADGTYLDQTVSGPVIEMGGDCAIVQQQNGFNVNLTSQSCTKGAYYACETRACSTEYYCV